MPRKLAISVDWQGKFDLPKILERVVGLVGGELLVHLGDVGCELAAAGLERAAVDLAGGPHLAELLLSSFGCVEALHELGSLR